LTLVPSAGHSQGSIDTTTLVGERLPYLPPSGSVLAAWASEQDQEQWLRHASEPAREQQALRLVPQRGYSVGLLSYAQRKFASALEAMAQSPEASLPTSLFGLIPHLSYDPPELTAETLSLVRQIAVPVFCRRRLGRARLYDLRIRRAAQRYAGVDLATAGHAAAATTRIGGRMPA
jgi:hypothetical protein